MKARGSGKDPGVLIVGGGLAAQRCAENLRRRGYEAPVRIVCAEADPPYDRPPLSKEVLAGTTAEGSVAFRAPEWYEENEVELLLGVRAERLDPEARTLELEFGGELEYGRLLIATGGISDAEQAQSLFNDVIDIFEQAAADNTPVRDIVGEDPVEFADALIRNYQQTGYVAKEQGRLRDSITKAVEEQGKS